MWDLSSVIAMRVDRIHIVNSDLPTSLLLEIVEDGLEIELVPGVAIIHRDIVIVVNPLVCH